MENEKKGFNLGVMISLIVGVIALIVVIPTISNVVHTPLREYHIKLSNSVGICNFDATDNLTDTTYLTINHNIVENGSSFEIAFNLTDMTIKTTALPTSISLADITLITISADYTDFSSGYGLYDFSAITTITENLVLTPVYTPLYE